MLSILGNVIWVIFGGVEVALYYFFFGILFCITIIGIPFGLKLFEIGIYALLPFGRSSEIIVPQNTLLSVVLNLFWLPFGIVIAIIHLVFGVLFCITIIGIPFGLQHFKLMSFAFIPFGRRVVER